MSDYTAAIHGIELMEARDKATRAKDRALAPTIASSYFGPKLKYARLNAIATGRSLSKILDHAELLQPDQRSLLDHALESLAEAVWAVDRLLGKPEDDR